MFQSEVEGRIVAVGLLIKDVPPEHHHDLDYLVGMLDWEANVNPEFAEDNSVFPDTSAAAEETEAGGLSRVVGLLRHAVVFGEGADGASESHVTIKDAAAYGLILTQGHGTFGAASRLHARDDPLRPDDGGRAVRQRGRRAAGVRIENLSATDPLVVLKHFGPGNPDEAAVGRRTR